MARGSGGSRPRDRWQGGAADHPARAATAHDTTRPGPGQRRLAGVAGSAAALRRAPRSGRIGNAVVVAAGWSIPPGRVACDVVAPIPTNPGLGPAFVGTIANPQPQASIDLFTFITPYNNLTNALINPNTANGYTVAGRVVNVTPVPEPASAALAGLGLAGLGLLARRHRRRRSTDARG